MYENGKMRPVETVPGVWGRGIKENDGGVDSRMIYLIHCKNISKCHNVSPPSTTFQKLKKFKKKKTRH
jgi:hypothetical protein